MSTSALAGTPVTALRVLADPRNRGSLLLWAFAAYMLVATAALIGLGVPIEPDRYLFVLMLPAVAVRRARRFLLDWGPFLLLLFAYEFLRGLAPRLGLRAHYLFGLRLDSTIFGGTVPTVTLQHLFYHPGSPRFYDYLGTLLYLLHFVTPLSFGLVLWLGSRDDFRTYVAAFMLLSYAALVTFVLFPAAPPWLAAQQGYLAPVHQVLTDTLRAFPARIHLPGIYEAFDPNPVAAVPSLHAAYPTLLLLFALRKFGRRGLVLVPYVAGVWLAIVYMGEHYVTDVIVGAGYSGLAYLVTTRLADRGRSGAESAARMWLNTGYRDGALQGGPAVASAGGR